MPIRKKGNIKVKTSPNRYGIEQTGYTFYSYDKNSAALVFTFVDSDNAPVNLSKADVRLLLISDNGDEFPVDKDDIDVISAIRGTARYVIPENLLGYEGKITGHIYLDFEDGSHTDEGRFIFNIKRSMISDVLPEAGDKYVQDFEDVKERVEQAGDSATKDIEKAKDDAESQIGDYVGEVESAKDNAVEDIDKALPEVVESAKQDISSSASDVQSTADKATSDIKSRVDAVENAKNSIVGDIEKAKDNAESQIGDYAGEIESAKQDISSSASDVQSKASEASEDISGLVKTTEDARDEAVKSMYELDYSDRNLLTGTSDEWEKLELTGWTYNSEVFDLEELGLRPGDTIAYSFEVDNTLDEIEQYIYPRVDFSEDYENWIVGTAGSDTDNKIKRIHSGEKGISKNIITIPSKAVEFRVFKAARNSGEGNKKINVRKHKLQFGTRVTAWTPAPEDIVLKSELEKIKQAIINLGGSI